MERSDSHVLTGREYYLILHKINYREQGQRMHNVFLMCRCLQVVIQVQARRGSARYFTILNETV